MFSSNLKTKKAIVVILILCLVLPGIFVPNTKKVEASGWPVVDALGNAILGAISWFMSQTVGGTSPVMLGVAKAGRIAIKRLLREVTKSIVTWIDNGFEGNPAFITNTDQFLRDTADIAIGDMLMGTDLEFLCDPFKIQVKLALGLQYRPFNEQIKCSFTDALGNVNNAMNTFLEGDFIGGGGWDSWLQMTTVPQNNQMGAMLLAQSELDARIETSQSQATLEASWGNGFMSWNECTDSNGVVTTGSNSRDVVTTSVGTASSTAVRTITDSPQTTSADKKCVIKTPGKEIVEQLGWAQSSSIREFELADDLDAIIGALVNQVIQQGLNLVQSDPSDGDNSRGNPGEINQQYLDSLQN
jgi:hypothetical protein